jgi:glycosyltransferase involved in cell wall biosynthesis
MPVEQLTWPDGMIDAFGYDYVLSRAIRRARFPSDYLVGLSNLTDQFDIINTSENFNLFSLQAALACKSEETKFVFSAGENIPYPQSQRNPLLWFMKRYVNDRAKAITTTSPEGKRALIHEGVEHDKITVLPNAIETENFRPKSDIDHTSVGLSQDLRDKQTILFVHGLREQKGIHDLLDAFESVRKNREVRLILIGTSELGRETEMTIRKDDEIQWINHVPYQFMPDLYNLADIFVLPSVTMVNNEEQFGMAALEAMSCGVPTVVTDTGGLPYVAEAGGTSLVVPERSPPELAAALKHLLDSPELRSELGDNGRKRAKSKFSPDTVGETLRQHYNQLLL